MARCPYGQDPCRSRAPQGPDGGRSKQKVSDAERYGTPRRSRGSARSRPRGGQHITLVGRTVRNEEDRRIQRVANRPRRGRTRAPPRRWRQGTRGGSGTGRSRPCRSRPAFVVAGILAGGSPEEALGLFTGLPAAPSRRGRPGRTWRPRTNSPALPSPRNHRSVQLRALGGSRKRARP
jgi:hypothetical protein